MARDEAIIAQQERIQNEVSTVFFLLLFQCGLYIFFIGGQNVV